MLSPAFTKENLNYTMQVPYEIKELTITAVAEDANAEFHVEGNSDFTVGSDNVVYIPVTAEDGTTKTYTVKVVREKKIDTTLSNIEVVNATLNPTFTPNVTDYIAYIGEGVADVTITPIATDALSNITIALNEGEYQSLNSITVTDLEKENTIKIKVEQSGNETIYTVALLTQSTEKITSEIYGHDISDGMIKNSSN